MNEENKNLVDEFLGKPALDEMSIFDAVVTVSENINKDKNNFFPPDSAEDFSKNESNCLPLEEQKILLKRISEYLKTNEVQSIIFCAVFAKQGTSRVELDDIAAYLNMKPVTLLRFKKDLEFLICRGLVDENRMFDRFDGTEIVTYTIPEMIIETIVEGRKIKVTKRKQILDVYKFLEEIGMAIEKNRAPRSFTFQDMSSVEKKFRNQAFVKEAKKRIPDSTNRFIFYMLASARIQDCQVSIGAVIRRFYNGPAKTEAKKSIAEGKHFLQQINFMELENTDFIDNADVFVTKKGLKLLMGEDAICYVKEGEGRTPALLPEKISAKELFYPEAIQDQLDTIHNAFQDENFKALQERLEKKGMHKGVAVLFYGAPGTGKTESVLQIAKKTDRAVFQVDISETKTMWFGESERLTKRIFTNYRSECEDAKRNGRKTPILFLNEADAVISKRRSLGENSAGPGQTENALQNIFLEEIENLEGILIATTNLADNMDSAFDRRFLFKVKFDKPETSARAKIWKSKLNFLSEKDACSLAENFEFSGGQIDNIARKIEIDEVITGITPSLKSIFEICRHETLNSEVVRRVGFCA